MKRFLSTNYSESAFNLAMLLIRLSFGLLILTDHGLAKLTHFGNYENNFSDPLHIGHRLSLVLAIFAEVVCSLLLVLGLLSRFAALVLIINMSVAAILVHKGQSMIIHEPALLYLTAFLSVLLVGPGKISVDSAMGK
ncbi:MAG TPA: DoxX family protein [Puia sp.]|nr:DoxX family protein [Puia sp.]